MLVRTRQTVFRVAKKDAQTAYGEIMSTPQGSTGVKTRFNGLEMRGQTGEANFVCLFRHRWGRRFASSWPNFWASLG
jgi:hypothetical protein